MGSISQTFSETFTSDQGVTWSASTRSNTYEDIDNYDRRILYLNRDKIQIAEINDTGTGSVDGCPCYDWDFIRFIRIANLMDGTEDAHDIAIQLRTNESTPIDYLFILPPKRVFILGTGPLSTSNAFTNKLGANKDALGTPVGIFIASNDNHSSKVVKADILIASEGD